MASLDTQQGVIENSKITIGPCTYGYEYLEVFGSKGVSLTIGSFCSIAMKTTIFLGSNHRTDWITTFPFGHQMADELGGREIKGHPASNGDVVIGNDVWIGYGSTIVSGVTIGSGAVIAANAHVVKDVAPYEIVGGNPAKHIRYRFDEEIRALLLELKWWDLPINIIKELNQTLSSEPTVDLLNSLVARYRT